MFIPDMNYLNFLFLKGLIIEPFERKTCSGFDGDFITDIEKGYKYNLYFINPYGYKYHMVTFDDEGPSSSGWSAGTFGHMEFYKIDNFPDFDYYPIKAFEPFNIKLFNNEPFITTSYLDFSFKGDNPNNERGYARINSECFVDSDELTEEMKNKINEEIDNFIDEFKKDPNKTFEVELIDSLLSPWNMSSYLRKKGASPLLKKIEDD